MSHDKRFSQKTLERELVHLPAVADRVRLRALDRSEVLARAREARLAFELARRSARDGVDSPAAERAGRNFLSQRRVRESHEIEIRTVEIGRGEIPRDKAAVLGRVVDPDRRPQEGLRVVVSDERGPGRYQMGEATTDASGHYLVTQGLKRFHQCFAHSENLSVTVTGGETQVEHTLIQPFGEVRRRLRVVDVRLPPEAFNTPPAAGDGASAMSDLPGLGPKRIAKLREAGIGNVGALAELSPEELRQVLRISEAKARELIERARELLGTS